MNYNKIALVTGGSSGIGLAISKALIKEGYFVYITGRNQEKLNEAINELGINALSIKADVAIYEENKTVIDQIRKEKNRLDLLINNAGMSMRALFKDVDVFIIEKLIKVNFLGSVYMTKLALPLLIESKGSIVAISSIAGYRGLPGRTGYSASKGAMQLFFESLRTELIPDNVNVLMACPGFTASNIRKAAFNAKGEKQEESPLDERKIMSAEKVAIEIITALKKNKRDLILTSQGKSTVFLNKMFPALMDKIVLKHFKKEKNSLFKSK